MAKSINRNPQNKPDLEKLWDWNLTNHKPTAEGIKKIESLRELAKDFAEGIIKLGNPGREQSLALTHTEDALFYALAAVARFETEDLA